jgi:hypothetical protein
MFLNFTSKNSKNELITRLKNTDFLNCRLKTQTTQKVRLDSNRSSLSLPLMKKNNTQKVRWTDHQLRRQNKKKKKTPITKGVRTYHKLYQNRKCVFHIRNLFNVTSSVIITQLTATPSQHKTRANKISSSRIQGSGTRNMTKDESRNR